VGEDRVRHFVFIVILFSSLLFANKDGGPYIGVGYTQGIINDDQYYSLKEDQDNGYKIELGAYINKYFSVALEYYDGLDYQAQSGEKVTLGFAYVDAQAHYLLWDDRIDSFVKFGAGEIFSNDEKGSCLVYGVGAGYWISERFSISGGYDYIDVGIDTTGNGAANKSLKIGIFFGMVKVQF